MIRLLIILACLLSLSATASANPSGTEAADAQPDVENLAPAAWITNDAVTFGLLTIILALVVWTSIGGAASAPVVAAAFHPSLAPVGVLLAGMGYALGTYGAYICGLMMQRVAP